MEQLRADKVVYVTADTDTPLRALYKLLKENLLVRQLIESLCFCNTTVLFDCCNNEVGQESRVREARKNCGSANHHFHLPHFANQIEHEQLVRL